jgi:hypothetical protein
VKTDLKTNATGRHLMETNVTLAVYADKWLAKTIRSKTCQKPHPTQRHLAQLQQNLLWTLKPARQISSSCQKHPCAWINLIQVMGSNMEIPLLAKKITCTLVKWCSDLKSQEACEAKDLVKGSCKWDISCRN